HFSSSPSSLRFWASVALPGPQRASPRFCSSCFSSCSSCPSSWDADRDSDRSGKQQRHTGYCRGRYGVTPFVTATFHPLPGSGTAFSLAALNQRISKEQSRGTDQGLGSSPETLSLGAGRGRHRCTG